MDRRTFLTRLGKLGLVAPVALAAPKLLSTHDSVKPIVRPPQYDLWVRLKAAMDARRRADPTYVPHLPLDSADWPAYLTELEQPRGFTGYHQNEIGVAGALLRQLRIKPEHVSVAYLHQDDRVLPGATRGLPTNEREYELHFKVLAPISTDMAWLNGREFFPVPALSPRGIPIREYGWDRRPPEPMCFSPMSTVTLNYKIRHDFSPYVR